MATVARGRRDRTLLANPGFTILGHGTEETTVQQWFYGTPTIDLTLVAPAAFDSAQTGIVLTGTLFGASQGAGAVELGDSIDYATATKVTQTVTAWADTSVTITAAIGSLTPGTLWLFITNNGGQRAEGRPVTVHRAAAFTSSPTANISAAGADSTTARLTAPSGKTTSDFNAGRRVDDSATTPSITVASGKYTELEWAIEATTAAASSATYNFRVVRSDGSLLTAYTVTPQWTIAGGATTYPVSLAGSISSAGAPAKQARRAIPLGGASLPPAGALARSTAKPLAGTVTSAGVLATIRAFLRTFTAAITSSATLTRSTARPLAGTVTSAGAVTRQTGKPLAGTVTSSSTLARAKVALLALAGAVSSAGAVTRRPGKSLAGVITSSSTLATARTFARALAGAIGSAGGLTRQTSKPLTGAITSAGALTRAKVALLALAGSITSSATLARRAGKSLAAGVASGGQLTRSTAKPLAGTVTPAGAMSRARVVLLAVAGALAPAGALTRRTSTALAGTVAPAGTLARQTRKALVAVLSWAGVTTPTTGGATGLWSWLLSDGATLHPADALLDGQPTTTDVGP